MPARDKCESQRVWVKDRQVRVFISSTFRDMMQERELLMKKVFFHLHIRDPVPDAGEAVLLHIPVHRCDFQKKSSAPFQAYPVRDNLRIRLHHYSPFW